MTASFADAAFMRRWALRLAIAWVALIYARSAWVSHAEYQAAELLRTSRDLPSAVAHYRRAARHYAPLADRVPESLEALEQIAADATRAGDLELALSAFRAMRGSILASRSMFVPHGAELARADHGIAALMARIDVSPMFRAQSRGERERGHLARLAREPREHPLGVLLTLAGFVLFVWASQRLVVRSVGIDDVIERSSAVRSALFLSIGAAAFVLGLIVT